MEIVKKNIHMNKLKASTTIQMTLDDDFNVSDTKPDIDKIIKDQGNIVIDSIKPLDNKINISGNLDVNILYISSESERMIYNIKGKIHFDEMINIEGVNTQDDVSVKWELEDLSTSIVNSRKISIKAIVTISCKAENLYDEETAIAIKDEENIQVLNKKIPITQVAITKKDIVRIKDEILLSSSKKNIFEILYSDITLLGHDIRLMQNEINIKGEILVFVLYSTENMELEYLEKELPFSTNLDINGCSEDMIEDILVTVGNKEISVKPDTDGEERLIDIELILELDIKAYKEDEIEILKDLYSTSKNLIKSEKKAEYENLLIKNDSKVRINDRVQIPQIQPNVLQVCSAFASVKIDDIEIVEDGISIDGAVILQIIYISSEDDMPLNMVKTALPYNHIVEVKNIKENSIYNVKPNIEHISAVMIGSKEIEAKIDVRLNTIVFDKISEDIITGVDENEINKDELFDMPSIIGYIVKKDDSLWNIAKKYNTTINYIKEMNEFDKDEVLEGERLLILKQIN